MGLFLSAIEDFLPPLAGERVMLRAPRPADFGQWSELRRISRDFLQPWEPTWPADDLTRRAFGHRLRRWRSEAREGTSLAYFLTHRDDGRLLGGLTLCNIRRGVVQTGFLGYWIGKPYAGLGYMAEATKLFCNHAFSRLGLHRVEAATLTGNERSQHLLEKAGFRREGHARGYLLIDDQWRDHYLYAMLADDPIGRPES